jgi:hypothetical protein
VATGIQNFVVTIEMALASVLHVCAFPPDEFAVDSPTYWAVGALVGGTRSPEPPPPIIVVDDIAAVASASDAAPHIETEIHYEHKLTIDTSPAAAAEAHSPEHELTIDTPAAAAAEAHSPEHELTIDTPAAADPAPDAGEDAGQANDASVGNRGAVDTNAATEMASAAAAAGVVDWGLVETSRSHDDGQPPSPPIEALHHLPPATATMPTARPTRPTAPTTALACSTAPTAALACPTAPTAALARPTAPTVAMACPTAPTVVLARPTAPSHWKQGRSPLAHSEVEHRSSPAPLHPRWQPTAAAGHWQPVGSAAAAAAAAASAATTAIASGERRPGATRPPTLQPGGSSDLWRSVDGLLTVHFDVHLEPSPSPFDSFSSS